MTMTMLLASGRLGNTQYFLAEEYTQLDLTPPSVCHIPFKTFLYMQGIRHELNASYIYLKYMYLNLGEYMNAILDLSFDSCTNDTPFMFCCRTKNYGKLI